jgi:cell division protein FtsB
MPAELRQALTLFWLSASLFRFTPPGARDLLAPMNVNLGIWSTLNRVVICLICAAILIGIGVWYLPLIRENEQYRKRILVLDGKIQKEEATGKQLKSSIESLRRDPKAVERLARESLGYAKPGETVIRFEAPSTNSVQR